MNRKTKRINRIFYGPRESHKTKTVRIQQLFDVFFRQRQLHGLHSKPNSLICKTWELFVDAESDKEHRQILWLCCYQLISGFSNWFPSSPPVLLVLQLISWSSAGSPGSPNNFLVLRLFSWFSPGSPGSPGSSNPCLNPPPTTN